MGLGAFIHHPVSNIKQIEGTDQIKLWDHDSKDT